MSRQISLNPAYPNGPDGILEKLNARRAPLRFGPGEALPPLDCNLDSIARKTVQVPPVSTKAYSAHSRKSWEIANELKGQNALLHLNGLLIAHLRKNGQPAYTADLFQRLWAEQSEILLREMDLRWKVSSLTTFGDHGKTPEQRSTGMGLSMLFGAMKLYESERMYSGRDPERPFTLDGRSKASLPLEMNAFALVDGGLDVFILGRLWEEADKDDVIRPLAHDLLRRVIDDPGTVFRRLHRLRARKLRRLEQDEAKDAQQNGIALAVPDKVAKPLGKTIKWGVVCTTNAPLLDVARFVAHHIDIGATHIYLYLDEPNPDVTGLLQGHPRVTVTVCDDAYWRAFKKGRPAAHQLRQAFNATRALRKASGVVDWLGHIDTDEFILSSKKLSTALKSVPADCAVIRVFPAEALASQTEGAMPKHFKLRTTGPDVPASAIHDVYPTFGSYLRGGFLSHLAGKVFARPGLGDVRLAIHRARVQGQDIVNTTELEDVFVGHLHAADWTTFANKLAFRQAKGSYRVKDDHEAKSVGRLLAYLTEEEGEEGLRLFFEEICLDTVELRDRLKRNDLLLTPKFDPNAALEKMFGIRITE